MVVRLTKSRLLSAHQCPKRLWLEVHQPEVGKGESPERLFRIGRDVGAVARTLYPGGTLIEHVFDPERAVQETQTWLATPGSLTLFEAAFTTGACLTRVDIFQRDAQGQTRLIEVKASASVKNVHIIDCAIQTSILTQSGTPVHETALAHIDSSFVYPGDGDYQGLLVEQDLTEDVAEHLDGMPEWVEAIETGLQKGLPEIEPGDQCTAPYLCPFYDSCNAPGPEYPISILPGKRAEKVRLLEEGLTDIRQIPEGYLTNERAEWMRAVTVSGQADVRPEAAALLDDLDYPRYYLDFETVGPAIPIWAGTRPYEALTFQWSCHTETKNGSLNHSEFLADGSDAPMRACAESLLETIGMTGPIFTYSSYEKTTIRNLAARYPDLAPALEALLARLVDLLPITKANYYHPALKGSWSIKSVLPTIAPELAYDDLGEIQEGMAAADGFLEMITPGTTEERRGALRDSLLRYCRLDTEAMWRLTFVLRGTRLPGPVHHNGQPSARSPAG